MQRLLYLIDGTRGNPAGWRRFPDTGFRNMVDVTDGGSSTEGTPPRPASLEPDAHAPRIRADRANKTNVLPVAPFANVGDTLVL